MELTTADIYWQLKALEAIKAAWNEAVVPTCKTARDELRIAITLAPSLDLDADVLSFNASVDALNVTGEKVREHMLLLRRNPLYRATYVPPTGPPTNAFPIVNLIEPTNGLVFATAPATVDLEATASDPDGAIHRLEFLRDNLIVRSFSHYNVASAFAGGVATASSQLVYQGNTFAPAGAIDGEINGINYGSGQVWHSADAVPPEWIQIDFASPHTINKITVFTYPNVFGNITAATLATTYGIVDFVAQSWNGTAWVDLVTVTANNKAMRELNFQAVLTSRIRIYVTATADGFVRILEVQAWATDVAAPSPATFSSSDIVPLGTYSYTAKAYDNLDAVTTSAAASVVVQTPPPVITPGGGNFVYRRSLPGTVRWLKPDSAGIDGGHGMNLTGTTGDNVGIIQGTYANPVLDTAVKASGLSSLRIDKPNTQPDSPNPGGDWFCNFSADELTTFSTGEEFFVQFRYRMNSIMYDTVFSYAGGFVHDGFKIAMIGAGDQGATVPGSSSISKIVMASYHQHRFPFFYHYNTSGATELIEYGLPGGDRDAQPGGPDPACAAYIFHVNNQMSIAIPPGCIAFYPNEWMTFQIGVTVGQFDGVNGWTNTRLRLWIARENQPSALAIDWVGTHPSGDGQFGKLWVSNYTSLNDGAQLDPFPNGGSVWYDEFIISTNKIPDPSPEPAWKSGLPLNTAYVMPNTKGVNASGNTSGFGSTIVGEAFDAWVGLVHHKGKLFCVAGGGHNTTWPHGSEIEFDANQDVPIWRFISPFTPAADIPSLDIAYSMGAHHFRDGRPSGAHTYYHVGAFDEENNRITMLLQQLHWGTHAISGNFASIFDYALKDWRIDGHWTGTPADFQAGNSSWVQDNTEYQSFPVNANAQGSVAIHPVTGDIYFAGYTTALGVWWHWKWTKATKIWTNLYWMNRTWDQMGSDIDVDRNMWVAASNGLYHAEHRIERMTLAAGNAFLSDLVVTGPGFTSGTILPSFGALNQLRMDPDNDRYLVISSPSALVHAIDPDTGAATLIQGTDYSGTVFNNVLGHAQYSAAKYNGLGGLFILRASDQDMIFIPRV